MKNKNGSKNKKRKMKNKNKVRTKGETESVFQTIENRFVHFLNILYKFRNKQSDR